MNIAVHQCTQYIIQLVTKNGAHILKATNKKKENNEIYVKVEGWMLSVINFSCLSAKENVNYSVRFNI